MVKYLLNLIWGKNVKYFILWAKSENFRKYRDQSVKRQILAEKAEFSDFQSLENYHWWKSIIFPLRVFWSLWYFYDKVSKNQINVLMNQMKN